MGQLISHVLMILICSFCRGLYFSLGISSYLKTFGFLTEYFCSYISLMQLLLSFPTMEIAKRLTLPQTAGSTVQNELK